MTSQNVRLKFYAEGLPDRLFINAVFDFLSIGDDNFIIIRQKVTNESVYFQMNDVFSIEITPTVS